MEFTNEELHEIEKLFDAQAGAVMQGVGKTLARLRAFDKEHKEFGARIIADGQESYDVCRTISAKASSMSKKKSDEE